MLYFGQSDVHLPSAAISKYLLYNVEVGNGPIFLARVLQLT